MLITDKWQQINILQYAFGEGEGVLQKSTLCTLS